MERGQENCYLLTNGLGGFSSQTMISSSARNDHALLMAAVKAHNVRYHIIHHLREELYVGGEEICLSSQEYERGEGEQGYLHLSQFSFEYLPEWIWETKGVQVEKQIGMKQGENTVAVVYRIANRRRGAISLAVTPALLFTPKGEDLTKEQTIEYEAGRVRSNGMELCVDTNGTLCKLPLSYRTYYYSYDACDGRRSTGLAAENHKILFSVEAGEEKKLAVVFRLRTGQTPIMDGKAKEQQGSVLEEAEAILKETEDFQRSAEEAAGFVSPLARTLSRAAVQFIARRESTKGETILAGFPFFEDWGRDTMIALPGLCISTGRFEDARSILRTFMAYCRKGLMPNLFPEGGKEPMYNTVDAALLFINAVYLYYEKTKDSGFVREAYPVMEDIVAWYQKGTEFAIHMDEDGLILAGAGLDQVTWMDVRVGEILPTPRHGKPVEINAYWYNALCILDNLAGIAGTKPRFQKLARKVQESFLAKFWMEDKNCLRDVLSGTKADEQIRCNQIWAVSLPFTMLPREKEKSVVDTVFETLYTPYGLRTLSMDDEEFHPFYGGEQKERDLAYHQGTVWAFPLGAYYLAYLKVYGESGKQQVREQLKLLEGALREGCVGSLPEIYDGRTPTRSKGCFAQAWSVGELLRVFEAVEKDE